MSLISALLAIVLFFSGFAVAQITAPKCSSTWEWVRKLSSPHCNFWPLIELTAFAFSRLILSAKIHVLLQRTCRRHVMGVVSRFLVLLCPFIGEPYRLISFAAYDLIPLPSGYHYEGPSGIDNSDLCKCNTVRYSLISACGGCQGERWITYEFCCSSLPYTRYLCICL